MPKEPHLLPFVVGHADMLCVARPTWGGPAGGYSTPA
jgi:hypothetical protein